MSEKKEYNLNKLRKDINKIDSKIIKLFSDRFFAAKKIARYKQTNNIPVKDKKREEQLINEIKKKAKKLDIDTNFSEKIFRELIEESCRIQKKINEDESIQKD
ncbi:hypothetical protein GF327_02640 [Candidatus Woesearchaeota archaeon]|nr:hypothetical protein [Candidatus Woesearchaeota archaeon]